MCDSSKWHVNRILFNGSFSKPKLGLVSYPGASEYLRYLVSLSIVDTKFHSTQVLRP